MNTFSQTFFTRAVKSKSKEATIDQEERDVAKKTASYVVHQIVKENIKDGKIEFQNKVFLFLESF